MVYYPPCPKPNRQAWLPIFPETPAGVARLEELTGSIPEEMTVPEVLWLAQLPLEVLGAEAWDIFQAIDKAGHHPFIPETNWKQAKEDHERQMPTG